MKLILLGAPGSGKGTQAEIICEKLGIPTISTGNILREAIKMETPLGMQAKSYMDAGKLVPDELIVGVIKDRLTRSDCAAGFILDGMPRTIAQAEALDRMGVLVDSVLSLEVDDAQIEARMSGRRVCENCGASYHVQHKKPKAEGVCDACGGKLVQRKDDAPETVRDRLAVYHEQTEPLKDYYASKGILKSVVGANAIEDTTKAVFAALGIA